MATAVFFHAHPDDEAIATGGTMAKMSDEGHRIVLVVATGGEEGEVADGFLEAGETLQDRRRVEVQNAGDILGVDRIVFLGYHDSGMMGEPTNGNTSSFWQVDVEEAAERLAAVLREEQADVLTVYDDHGGYGHPDHIQVHRVGHRAADLASTPRVFEATINRDVARWLQANTPVGDAETAASQADDDWIERLGLPETEITTAVDISGTLDRKKRAMLAHESQIPPDSWFFSLGDEGFARAWGREWFRQATPPFEGDPIADRTTSLL